MLSALPGSTGVVFAIAHKLSTAEHLFLSQLFTIACNFFLQRSNGLEEGIGLDPTFIAFKHLAHGILLIVQPFVGSTEVGL